MPTRKSIVEKWEKARGKMSIKDVEDPYIKENLAQLLENQETKDFNGQDLFESSMGQTYGGGLGADSNSFSQTSYSYSHPATSDAWKFRPVALALVRRTFPDLFANKIVGVQAMSTPVGLAYALRVLYDDANGKVEAAWDNVDYYGGYTGSQAEISATLAGVSAAGNFANNTGIKDTSGAGINVLSAEAWTLENPNIPTATSTSGTVSLSYPYGFGAWPQLKLKIDQTAIEAKTRKLAASFSLEAAQDIRAMHGLDVEREMVNFLQYEITAELDRELLYRLKRAATDTANGGASIAAVNVQPSTSGFGRWAGESYMSVVAAIVHQANKIAVSTKRAPGNFAVVSSSVASVLQAAGHQFVQYKSDVKATQYASAIGKLNGNIDVYRDQYARTDYALVGYKGPGVSDCGVIFSPYIMGLTNRAISQEDFSPRVGVMSRYAITETLLGSGRYYRLIPFYNMNTILAGA
jgi:hypothetical protein